MRFYLDTEFNGFGGELISLALVSEWVQVPMAQEGHKMCHEFYAARKITKPHVEWVKEHVLPVLRTHIMSPVTFKYEFQKFIQNFPECEVICDWHTDAILFYEMLSGHDYASSLDFPCTTRVLRTPKGFPVSALPHNALEDARALREWHESVGVGFAADYSTADAGA